MPAAWLLMPAIQRPEGTRFKYRHFLQVRRGPRRTGRAWADGGALALHLDWAGRGGVLARSTSSPACSSRHCSALW